jgi:hypothetical protein
MRSRRWIFHVVDRKQSIVARQDVQARKSCAALSRSCRKETWDNGQTLLDRIRPIRPKFESLPQVLQLVGRRLHQKGNAKRSCALRGEEADQINGVGVRFESGPAFSAS